jgi:SAM-dependent methyltransferase
MRNRIKLIDSYDELAFEYAERFCDELDGKPFDRSLLQRFANMVPSGPVCDLGCGPGHVTAHLQSLGLKAIGVDLSPKMIEEARRRFTQVEFRVGDMVLLDIPTESLGGIVALYSIIHLEPEMLEPAFREMCRVLVPGGQLLVSFHQGQGILHEDDVLGTRVSFDCTLFESDDVSRALECAGLSVAEVTVRRPYGNEYPTKRVYVLANKTAD